MLLLAGFGFEQKMIEKAPRPKAKKNTSGSARLFTRLVEAIGQNEAWSLPLQLNDGEPFTIKTPSLTIAMPAPITTFSTREKGRSEYSWMQIG